GQSGQPRQPDGTLVTAQSSARGRDRANGHSGPIGAGAARAADSNPYQGIGETAAQHRPPRSLFDPAPAADHARTQVAGPANRASATDSRTETPTEARTQTAREPSAESPPETGAKDAKAAARTEPESNAGTRSPNLTPVPGSWADLRQRLERLPYGHPSSPYHVDGERKPPPPRLKHLELAPPRLAPPVAPVPDRPSEPPARSRADDLQDAEHNQQHSRPMPTFTPAGAGPSQPAQHDSPVSEPPRMPATRRPEPGPRRPAEP